MQATTRRLSVVSATSCARRRLIRVVRLNPTSRMAAHELFLIGGLDDETASLEASPKDGLCYISLLFRDQTLEAAATDYFEAFCQIRSRLEAHGIIPFCYGASLNVYPSGMCRDMSAGMTAYKLTKGTKPSRDTLVRIFESGPDVIPSYVAAQKQFFDEWFGIRHTSAT